MYYSNKKKQAMGLQAGRKRKRKMSKESKKLKQPEGPKAKRRLIFDTPLPHLNPGTSDDTQQRTLFVPDAFARAYVNDRARAGENAHWERQFQERGLTDHASFSQILFGTKPKVQECNLEDQAAL